MPRPFLTRVFSLGPISEELRGALLAEYAPVEITELPWQADNQERPTLQAARLYLALERAGGMGMTMGERILCVPRAFATLIYFFELVHSGDYGIPKILISDEPAAAQDLHLSALDCAIIELRDLW